MDKNQEPYPPLQLRVRELEKDMVLARPVYSRNGCTLLQEGKQLTTQDIDRLKRWKKRYVYVVPQQNQTNKFSDGFARVS